MKNVILGLGLLSVVTACGGSSSKGGSAGAASGSRIVGLKSDLQGVASIGVTKAGLNLTGGSEGLGLTGFDEEGNKLAKELLSVEDSTLAFSISNMVTVSGSIVADILILNPEETKSLLPGQIPTEYSVKMDSGLDSVKDCQHLIRVKKDGAKDCFITSGVSGQYVVRDYYSMDSGIVIVNIATGEAPGENLYAVNGAGVATKITNNSHDEEIFKAYTKILGDYFGFGINTRVSGVNTMKFYVWKEGMASPALVGDRAAVGASGDHVLSPNGFSDLQGNKVEFTSISAGLENFDASYIGDTVSAAVDSVDGKLQVISRNGIFTEVNLEQKTLSTNIDVETSGILNSCGEKEYLFVNHIGFAIDRCKNKLFKFLSGTALSLTASDSLSLLEVETVSGLDFSDIKNIKGKLVFAGVDSDGSNIVGAIDPASGETTKIKVDVAVFSVLPL